MNNEASAAQIAANILNARKSTGPRTEAGKNAARFNARRHGLTGQFYCMSEDDEQAYKAFEANLLGSLQPVGAYEVQLAISITQDHWRLNRSRGIEHNIYGQGHDEFAETTDACSPNVQAASTMADTYRDENRVFANIALYETRIHRMIARNRKDLDDLQARRRAAEKQALEETELLLKLAQFVDEKPEDVGLVPVSPTNPDIVEVFGFVFSIAAVRAKIKRDHHLELARDCAKKAWDRNRITIQRLPDLPHAA
jgi:hypothetical protein